MANLQVSSETLDAMILFLTRRVELHCSPSIPVASRDTKAIRLLFVVGCPYRHKYGRIIGKYIVMSVDKDRI